MTFLSPVSDNERRVAVTLMASARLNIPNTADALKNLRDDMMKKKAAEAAAAKKKQAVGKSTEGATQPPEHIYESSPERSPQKKRPRKNPPADKGKRVESSARKQVAVSQPDSSTTTLSNLSSFDDPTSFLENSFDYVLPADDKHLQKMKLEEVFDTTFLSAFHVR